MKYCKKCLYPINAKPTIIFDDREFVAVVVTMKTNSNLEMGGKKDK